MKQILQNARTGALELADVPAPTPVAGQVLVRNCYSVMSPGTEKLAMSFARSSLLGKARSRPDLVRQVVRKLQLDGAKATYRSVTTRLEAPQPMGYSSAGVVEAVGEGVEQFSPGQRVACAGAGYANHAEYVVVPENLVAPVPDKVPLEHACFATLGAIALQGVRIANPTLGEVAVVVGLGLLGQISVQLVQANGCRALGIDVDDARLRKALDAGLDWGARPSESLEPWIEGATGGHGADFALVTASSQDARPLALAAEASRKKARIVLVGAMPIEIDRRLLYDKELDLRMSTSYGPGRYDRRYEELGLDYPLPYVRWTENRNLRAFLDLLETGKLRPERLDVEQVDFDRALDTYEGLAKGENASLAAVFRYDDSPAATRTLPVQREAEARPRLAGDVGVAFLGAGNYARGVLLPALADVPNVRRRALVTVTGASALRAANRFDFEMCGTDPDVTLEDPKLDLVFVATRHDSHASLAIRALRAGKAVWLEKPAALSHDELDELAAVQAETGGFLTVGYNRRFSPHGRAVRETFEHRKGALAMRYRIVAGPPPRGTWVTDPREGGGRVVGEVCHFVDLCNYVAGDLPRSVYARILGQDPEVDDSLVALLVYPDGSTAAIEYLAHASEDLAKERFEASADGVTAEVDNFRSTHISDRKKVGTFGQDKGQAAAIREVVDAIRSGGRSPFAPQELWSVSRTTFAMLDSIASGAVVEIPR